jgi:SNF2 family DNA or RNA helicase
MRQLVGYALIDPTVEMVEQFLLEHLDDGRKISIGVHHKNVANILIMKLREVCKNAGFNPPLQFESALSAEQRNSVIEQFRDDLNSRVCVLSTQSGGEGLNLQFCQDAILMERQWNPANEEQFEGRFSRIGSTASYIRMVYPTALGTINEFFAELVERKRGFMSNTLDGKPVEWNENSLMKELAQVLMTKGLKKFSLA